MLISLANHVWWYHSVLCSHNVKSNSLICHNFQVYTNLKQRHSLCSINISGKFAQPNSGVISICISFCISSDALRGANIILAPGEANILRDGFLQLVKADDP
eukprot:CCRYP_019603-RD/>CCRYP_019603-RD protein AED:0.47 eAED:1.00 QI:0/0/0/1/0/0/2/0/101